MPFLDTSGQQSDRLAGIPIEIERQVIEGELRVLTATERRELHCNRKTQRQARLESVKRDPHAGIRTWAQERNIPLE